MKMLTLVRIKKDTKTLLKNISIKEERQMVVVINRALKKYEGKNKSETKEDWATSRVVIRKTDLALLKERAGEAGIEMNLYLHKALVEYQDA